MQILIVCSLFVAGAMAHGSWQGGSGPSPYSVGLRDIPYITLYDSKRDGPNEPPGIRPPGLIDIPYEVLYDSRMSNQQQQRRQQPQPMRMNNYQRQPTRAMNNYQVPQQKMYQPARQMPQQPSRNNYQQQQPSNYGNNLIDIEYEVLYDSKRDGPNEPAGIRPPGLIDIPYEVLYDSRAGGAQNKKYY